MAEQSRERWSVYRQTRFRRERNDDVMRQHQLGTSGLTILRKIETGALLTVAGSMDMSAHLLVPAPQARASGGLRRYTAEAYQSGAVLFLPQALRLGTRRNSLQLQRYYAPLLAIRQAKAVMGELSRKGQHCPHFQQSVTTLSGKPTRAAQYAIGNPRLPIQMIEQAKDTAFYAPLRLTLLAELGSSGDARSVAFMFLFLSM
jgi:hypothetical protein